MLYLCDRFIASWRGFIGFSVLPPIAGRNTREQLTTPSVVHQSNRFFNALWMLDVAWTKERIGENSAINTNTPPLSDTISDLTESVNTLHTQLQALHTTVAILHNMSTHFTQWLPSCDRI